MLQRVTATRRCVSTRCDLWWETEISPRSLPLSPPPTPDVFSSDPTALGVSQTAVQSGRVRAALRRARKNVSEVNAYTTEGFYVM